MIALLLACTRTTTLPAPTPAHDSGAQACEARPVTQDDGRSEGAFELVPGELYVVHSGLGGGTERWNTANLWLLRGTSAGGVTTVWASGAGYGDPGGDVASYNGVDASRDAAADAGDVDRVLRSCLGLSPEAVELAFVSPHFHLDHLNADLFLALADLGYAFDRTTVYVQEADWTGATCGSACCGSCDGERSPWWGAPYDPPWPDELLARFQRIGDGAAPCEEVLTFETPGLGPWSAERVTGHTDGALDLVSRACGIRVFGSASDQCLDPADTQVLGPHGPVRDFAWSGCGG